VAGRPASEWRKTLEAAGLTEILFHDLRHTGNMQFEAGASLRELMDRMGFLPWCLWRFLEDAHPAAPGLFLLTSVGIVAMYGPRCGCPGCVVRP
jgi:hypothetical protein